MPATAGALPVVGPVASVAAMASKRFSPTCVGIVSFAGVVIAGCPSSGDDYHATIRRTSHGIPHIVANDLGSLGFGQGYAFAQDHACVLQDQILKVRSERSRWFGPGEDDANLDTDFAYLHLGIYAAAEEDFADQAEDVQQLVRGYAAGYDAWLDEVGADGLHGPCKGEPWVREITEIDLFAYYIDLGLLASGRQMIDYIATAQPPGGQRMKGGSLDQLSVLADSELGSNGWGIGSQMSSSGGGMLLANPHFPWEGELRLWESQLTVPGELDVYGVGLMGVPGILIGFNEAVAWTHTVSAGQRFTMYKLVLADGKPTTYRYDGGTRDMESVKYAIEVLQDDGSVDDVERTLWRSHYGPILNIEPFGWSAEQVFTYRDGNLANRNLISQFLGMNRASSLEEFKRVHEEQAGIPWVNTIATAADGRAWYMDSTPTPNASQETIDAWLAERDSGFFAKAFWQLGVVLFDGSIPRDEWVEEDGAREPGLVPFARLPQLERDDFVFNANDSHWLTNPAAPLEGYSILHGEERTPRSPRTRMNATLLTEGNAGLAGDDGKFTLEELQAAALSNRSMMAELLRDAVVARCEGVAEYDGVPISDACDALAGWDTRFDLESVGAIVFREFLGDFDGEVFLDEGVLFAQPFDPDAPVATPSGLTPANAPDDDRVLEALADAVGRLDDAGLPADTPLGMAQFTRKGDTEIPMHGGGRSEGITNLIVYSELKSTLEPSMERDDVINLDTDLTYEGYVVNYGTSFIMTLQYGEDGPEAEAFLTYSESSDPDSDYYADQTALFSEKNWRKCLFREDDILADPELVTESVTGPRE